MRKGRGGGGGKKKKKKKKKKKQGLGYNPMLSRNTFRWVSFNPVHHESISKKKGELRLVERR